MNIPSVFKGESILRLLQGTALGAVAAISIGFIWGGWTLGSTAEKMAENDAENAVVEVLAPICVEKFNESAEVVANLEEFNKITSYRRTSFVEDGGWATFGESDKASAGVAKACALLLGEVS